MANLAWNRRSWWPRFGLLFWLAMAVLVVGCGPSKPPAKLAGVQAGEMPADGSWEGVFFDPVKGNIHIVVDGTKAKGGWQTPTKESWGRLDGTVEGNLMKFKWEEYLDGVVGPNSKRSGRGYFVYTSPAEAKAPDIIKGEMGRGDDEVGYRTLNGVKQRDLKPNLDAVIGSSADDIGGGDWDRPNTEAGKVEPPAKPADDDDDDDGKEGDDDDDDGKDGDDDDDDGKD
ncbi:MAG: hypothetical protein AAGA56_13645, partial [Myxococcota bacterium]